MYLDTSVLVTALTAETGTDRVREWLVRHQGEDLRISDWVITEFSAALSMKVRVGDLAAARRAATMRAFDDLVTRSVGRLSIGHREYQAAARLCADAAAGLRAGDALHLAVAAASGAAVATLDKGMIKAARRVKIRTVAVLSR